MANSLQRSIWSHGRGLRTTLVQWSRPFSADALVEKKPSEIGVVSGIPDEHLRRRVLLPSSFFSWASIWFIFFDPVSNESCSFNFSFLIYEMKIWLLGIWVYVFLAEIEFLLSRLGPFNFKHENWAGFCVCVRVDNLIVVSWVYYLLVFRELRGAGNAYI